MKRIALAAMTLLVTLGSPVTFAADDKTSPLQPFERLVGGRWQLGETVQEFRWDLDRRQVTARGYAKSAQGERLVSVGAWYHHPGEDALVGYFVARDMGIDLFEYTTRFEGDVMINQVVAWTGTETGEPSTYEEHWRFTGDDSYVWELYETGEQGPKKVMEGVFERVE